MNTEASLHNSIFLVDLRVPMLPCCKHVEIETTQVVQFWCKHQWLCRKLRRSSSAVVDLTPLPPLWSFLNDSISPPCPDPVTAIAPELSTTAASTTSSSQAKTRVKSIHCVHYILEYLEMCRIQLAEQSAVSTEYIKCAVDLCKCGY